MGATRDVIDHVCHRIRLFCEKSPVIADVHSRLSWIPNHHHQTQRFQSQAGMRTMSSYFLRVSVSPNTRPISKVRAFSSWFSFWLIYPIATVEHNLTGDVLCLMGPEDLKEIGVATVGQRLAILKAIYIVKLTHDVPIELDHYIPPC